MDVEGLVERRFLLVKRGLYYGPNNSGYTGFKERAGRYLESDARPDSGVTAIHEDEADEIAPACFDDLAREYLTGKLAAAAEALSRHKAAGEVMAEALQSIHQGAELGRALFEERVHDRKDRLTWWAVNVLQDHLACSGATAERALTAWNSIGADRD